MAKIGYARVSTNGQDLAGQTAELKAAGCTKIYAEKVSGAKTDRPQLAKLLRAINAGDVLIVTRLDRLARSTRDLLNILDIVAKAKAGFRSLKDTWADTTTPHGRLMLTVLGGLAEFERELIRARTGEGRTRAKARGVKFGRPPKLPSPASWIIHIARKGKAGFSFEPVSGGSILHWRPWLGVLNGAAGACLQAGFWGVAACL